MTVERVERLDAYLDGREKRILHDAVTLLNTIQHHLKRTEMDEIYCTDLQDCAELTNTDLEECKNILLWLTQMREMH